MERDDARPRLRMLRPLRRSTDRPVRRLRRGVYLLPSMFTIGNMFCGYACIVHAMRGVSQNRTDRAVHPGFH